MDEKEKLFLELIDGFEWKYDVDKYPFSLFGFKDDICILNFFNMEKINHKKIILCYRLRIKQNFQNYSVWVNYDKTWSIFEKNFKMKYNDIQSFINDMLENHFKISGIKTEKIFQAYYK